MKKLKRIVEITKSALMKKLKRIVEITKSVLMKIDSVMDLDLPAGAPYDRPAHKDTLASQEKSNHQKIQDYMVSGNNNVPADYPCNSTKVL